MKDNEQIKKIMDDLYSKVNGLIKISITNPIRNYDDDLFDIHMILEETTQQLGLVNKGQIKCYDLITLRVLESYKLLQEIILSYKATQQIDLHIKMQLLSKTLQVFTCYLPLLNNKKATSKVKQLMGSKKGKRLQYETTEVLLPCIVARYLTQNEGFMMNDFLGGIFVEVLKPDEKFLSVRDAIIRYLQMNNDTLTTFKVDIENKDFLNNIIYAIFEDFFNEVLHSKKGDFSDGWLSGIYIYEKFNKYKRFSDYKRCIDPCRNLIFKKIKYLVKLIVI